MYNGWQNYETWNVALYIQNEEPLYRVACRCDDYSDFLLLTRRIRDAKTPDGVKWDDKELDISELDELIISL